MACNDNKKFVTSEASTKAWLRTRNVIDKYLNILDLNKFRNYNTELSNDAKVKYNVTERLFFEENNGKKALPNRKVFKEIDNKKGIVYESRVNTPIKPGVQELFNSNSELANIGTPEQYSQYLDTIFPDSKVKDIVYHGSIYDNKQEFKKSTRVSGNYFAVNPNEALQHAQRQLQNKEDAVLYSILLDIKNPKIITKPIDYEDLDTEVKIYKGDTVFGTNYDAIIAEKVEEYNATKSAETVWLEKQIVIFEPSQAHILGTKQDVDGFKEFVNNKGFESRTTSEGKMSSDEVEKVLTPFIKTLTDKFRVPVKLVNNSQGNFVGRYDSKNKIIEINTAKINSNEEAIFGLYHEFLHPAVIAIRNSNPMLAKALYNQAVKKYGPEFVRGIKEQYPDYTPLEFQDELLVQVVEKMLKEGGLEQLTESNTASDSLLLNTFNSYWNSIKAFVTDVINTVLRKNKLQEITSDDLLNIKSLDALKELMISNKAIDLTGDITTVTGTKTMFEKRTQDEINAEIEKNYNTILTESNKLKLTPDNKNYTYEGSNTLLTRVTTLLDKVLKQGEIKTDDSTSNVIGTSIHNAIENIIKRKFINPNEPINTKGLDSKNYEILEKYIDSVLNSYPKGTKFIPEVKVANLRKKYAGTIDLVVLNVDGTVDIYDWKSMKINAAARKAGLMPFWKERRYTLQMGFYKEALQQYGITDFNKVRLMPMELVYDKNNKFKTIKTEVNSNDEVLKALPLLAERTKTNEEIDSLLDKLTKLYTSLSERASDKKSKDLLKQENVYERLRALRKSIRDLQTKKSFDVFVESSKLELNTITEALKSIDKYSDADISEFFELANFYSTIDKSLFKTIYNVDTSKAQQVKNAIALKDIREMAFQIGQELENVQKQRIIKVSEGVGVKNIFSEFMGIGTIGKWFNNISQVNIPIIKTFWKLVEKQKFKVTKDLKDLIEKAEEENTKLEQWAKSNGLSLQQAFDKIINKKTGNLINKYSSEFYTEKAKAIKNNDIKWLKENTEFDKNKIKEFIDKTTKSIKEQKYHYKADINESIKTQRLNDFLKNYDLIEHYDTAILNKKNGFVKPKDKFFSTEWRDLINPKNKPLYDYYQFFTKQLDSYKEFLPVDYKGNFIPNIQKDFIEKVTTTGINAVNNMDWVKDVFRVTANDQFGEIDELTGEPKRTVPIYFVKEIEVDKKSFDLTKSLVTFSKVALTYKYMEEIEGTARLLRNQLSESKEIETNILGNTVFKESGEVQLKNVSSETIQAFDEYINYYVYGVTNTTKDRALQLGDDKYSLNKGVQNVLAFNTKRALAFNTLSATANLIGGMSNLFGVAARNKWFDRSNFLSAIKDLGKGPNLNELPYAAIEYFDIMGEKELFNKINNLSTSGIIKKYKSDNWFILQKGGDWVVQNTVVLSLLKSHTLDNGKVVPISKIKDAKSLYDMLEIKNDKLNLQELLSDEEYLKLRNKMQRIAELALGMTSRDNINLAKLSLAGKVIMQFRNWMPRLAEERFGSLKYDEDLESYMSGKYASFFMGTLLTKKALPLIKEMILGFGENTKERARELWVEAKAANPLLEITEEEFYNLHVENLRAMQQELILIMAGVGAYMAVKPDPDDDEASKLRKHFAKTMARSVDELSFFLSPESFNNIFRRPIPLQNLIESIFKFNTHLVKEVYGQTLGDEKVIESAKPGKYFARIFPIANEVERWFPDMELDEENFLKSK